jgi:hypothetical protein
MRTLIPFGGTTNHIFRCGRPEHLAAAQLWLFCTRNQADFWRREGVAAQTSTFALV